MKFTYGWNVGSGGDCLTVPCRWFVSRTINGFFVASGKKGFLPKGGANIFLHPVGQKQ